MKKPLFSLICAFALLFSSCSKEETAAPKDERLYPVTFNVSTFSKEIVPMASLKKTAGQIDALNTSGKALSDAVRYIQYAVYNESGIKVKDLDWHHSEPAFGKIEDTLPKGQYKILIFASSRWRETPHDYSNSQGYHMDQIDGGDELFFDQFDLSVTEKSNNDRSVTLSRKVGKLEIVLEDNIPSNINRIAYSISGVSSYFIPKSNQGHNASTISSTNHYLVEEGEADYNQGFNLFFMLDSDLEVQAFVNIRAYDIYENLVVDKTIKDVPVAINKITRLTGRLFDNRDDFNGQAFSVILDDKWKSDINHVKF